MVPVRDSKGNLDPIRTLASGTGIPEARAEKLLDPARPLSDEDIQWIVGAFPGQSHREWYEHFHRSELAYFLGKREGGAIDYRLPPGMSFEDLGRLDLFARLESLSAEPGSPIPRSVIRSIRKSGNPGERTLVQLSRWSGLDRRLLFLYFRREDLRSFLEAGD